MIDNTAHEVLVEAADETGWDEETMMLMATRFIADLGDDEPAILGKFEAYLKVQVAAEERAGR